MADACGGAPAPPTEDAVRARWEKATPGPWTVSDTSIVTDAICIAVVEDDGEYAAASMERKANAEAIANAPTDIAWMLSALSAARARALSLEKRVEQLEREREP